MGSAVQNWLQPALSVVLGERGTCDIRFSLQGEYVSDGLADALRPLGVADTVVTVNGSALNAPNTVTEADFIDVSDDALTGIRNRFTNYLANNGLLRGADDLFILDIEGVISPVRIGGLVEPDPRRTDRKDAVVKGYTERIRVVREVLLANDAPEVKLGLYQVIRPDPKGQVTDAFRDSMYGYRHAGSRGMYDQLDYICPVLYQRFGPPNGTAEQVLRWFDDATRQGIDSSLTLTRSDGAVVPLCPILTFWVANRPPEEDAPKPAILPELMRWQLRTLRRYRPREVAIIVLWAGAEDTEGGPKPREEVDYPAFLDDVVELPPPGCSAG
jgi:hypothetical protein